MFSVQTPWETDKTKMHALVDKQGYSLNFGVTSENGNKLESILQWLYDNHIKTIHGLTSNQKIQLALKSVDVFHPRKLP